MRRTLYRNNNCAQQQQAEEGIAYLGMLEQLRKCREFKHGVRKEGGIDIQALVHGQNPAREVGQILHC